MAPDRFSQAQGELWACVEALWEMAAAQNMASVTDALHPDYVGWVTGQPRPHDRDAAIAAIGPSTPRILAYRLQPLGVTIFEETVGVVHYSYEAEVEASPGVVQAISGRWSEIYLRMEGRWTMISVSGGPDGER
ncbi:hypothetical protein SLG_15820 [Sphingobium sp. SYK-6]|uniref:nuclear transport factor 2 family protein n=1 Tax=Sphingobium sp. (strain NBRC 103272 / SYK-6) TaxID=627192 RepID=UPI0002276F55|nr:nuclear transport factor 2 family protein [Sphingobium sp. SYK-6]BAK66257.1 hypothetical protein SLG_15820 [Sphingobium sp. SYK-6]